MNDQNQTIELLTVPEAAKLLRISASGMRRLQQDRLVPFFKVGGRVRFSKDDIVAYLENRRVGTIRAA